MYLTTRILFLAIFTGQNKNFVALTLQTILLKHRTITKNIRITTYTLSINNFFIALILGVTECGYQCKQGPINNGGAEPQCR